MKVVVHTLYILSISIEKNRVDKLLDEVFRE